MLLMATEVCKNLTDNVEWDLESLRIVPVSLKDSKEAMLASVITQFTQLYSKTGITHFKDYLTR